MKTSADSLNSPVEASSGPGAQSVSSKQAPVDYSLRQCFLHLVAFSAFTTLQPILGLLAGNLQYLRFQHFSTASLILTLCLQLLLIPVTVTAILLLLKRLHRSCWATRVFHCVLGGYSVLIILLALRWISGQLDLLNKGVSESLLAVLIGPVGIALPILYRRFSAVRQMITLSAAGALFFPVTFFASAPVREVVLGIAARDYSLEPHAKNPVPVVIIVFDGMTGMSLLDENYQIDSVRYPNFARLGGFSTYFRNATTVHTRTDHALPAMLSGTFPEENWRPVESFYPTNLLRMLFNGQQYEMTVFEPVTQMSPPELRQALMSRTLRQETSELLDVTGRVFLNLALPSEFINISIPRAWFGLMPLVPYKQQFIKGQIVYPWDHARPVQADHFVSLLKPSSRPGFYFLHIAVPHYPWDLLPDGRSYQISRLTSLDAVIPGLKEELWSDDPLPVNQAWQRNLLQIQYADRIVGQILDQLQQQQMLDESLVLVTADHGMGFVPGRELRELGDETTLPDLLSVPLFVKTPSQQTGSVSDKSVESIDILPTIADILEFPASPDWAGCSVFSAETRLRKTICGHSTTIIDAAFPARFEHTDRMISVFGSGTNRATDRLGRLNVLPQLVGRNTSDLEQGPSTMRCLIAPWPLEAIPLEPSYIPCLVHGKLLSPESSSEPILLAIAVEGVIAVTTRTIPEIVPGTYWSALIPPDILDTLPKDLALFEVKPGAEGNLTLHRIELQPETTDEQVLLR